MMNNSCITVRETLSLDRQWLLIDDDIKIDKTDTDFILLADGQEPQPYFSISVEPPQKISQLEYKELWNNETNSFMFVFLLLATSLYIVSSANSWKCFVKELFLPMRKRMIR